MTTALTAGEDGFRLTFKSKMTIQYATEIENMILDALRRHMHIEVDLSKVREIDLCGMHLLGFLESFIDKGVVIVATSPIVEQASAHLNRNLLCSPELPVYGARSGNHGNRIQHRNYPARNVASRLLSKPNTLA